MESIELASLPLFDGLSDEVVAQCASKFEEAVLLKGTVLAGEGQFAYKFFVVLEGDIDVQRNFEHVARLGPGDFFGEMGVIEGGRRNARVVTQSRCRVASMMGWDFEQMMVDNPDVAARIQAAVDERSASLRTDD